MGRANDDAGEIDHSRFAMVYGIIDSDLFLTKMGFLILQIEDKDNHPQI